MAGLNHTVGDLSMPDITEQVSFTTVCFYMKLICVEQHHLLVNQCAAAFLALISLGVCHILLQELVDVYMEYPFFVRGRGWSSCSPQRTARLCGLQCRQLTVGDVCLALTPVSASRPPPSANTEPKASPRKPEGSCEFIKAQQTQLPPVPEPSAGGQETKAEAARRRHHSAPELRGQRTDCLEWGGSLFHGLEANQSLKLCDIQPVSTPFSTSWIKFLPMTVIFLIIFT